ncbi:ileal sodium/bile acid cotransporter-like isoform X1 [Ptychodera flava]|uniref:ileal sodium/bile acid cotransporter-like isoform X1 n=1 Tax=Ptychodera flava TaxID=63121 RepID=UPI003969C2F7
MNLVGLHTDRKTEMYITTEAMVNASNTTSGFSPPLNLVIGNQININLTLALIMIAMGCTMTLQEVKQILVKPVAITVGALCQFGLMPTLGFALAHIFKLTPNMAIGTIIVSCCPGGLASNFFTYWTEGDITLSVCMTTASNILGIGMMPLCIYLYSQSWANISSTVLPRSLDIVIALVLLLVPAVFGMLIRWKAPKYADKIAMVLNILVNFGLVVFLTISAIAFTPLFKTSWQPYAVAILYPLLAFILGYAIAWFFKRNKYQCRTIAFETGIQNSALALSLINLLILQNEGAGGRVAEMMVVPTIHSFTVLTEGFLIIFLYWFYKKAILKEKGFLRRNSSVEDKMKLEKAELSEGKVDGLSNPGMTQMVEKHAQTEFSNQAESKNYADTMSSTTAYL